MTKIELIAKSFRKMEDPTSQKTDKIKYICYVQCSSIPRQMDEWLGTNPREQKMSTDVARNITESLRDNINFHELNRGIVLSVDSASYDTKASALTINLSDSEIHGNIDGGHTLRAILDLKTKNQLSDDRYVFMEIFTGITSPVELAEARNTAVQVDLKSIEELKSSFSTLKSILSGLPFENRVQYKMNEHYNNKDISPIDVREIIALIIMFCQEIYPVRDSFGRINDNIPIQCYSGKEASLRKFLRLANRDAVLLNMKNIVPGIFQLWNTVEKEFADKGSAAGKRYGTRKYSRYDEGKIIDETTTYYQESGLRYYVPRGLMYPIIGAFRPLIQINNGVYEWAINPIKAWNDVGHKLVATILDEQAENPDVLAKNANLWSNLLKEVFIYAYIK